MKKRLWVLHPLLLASALPALAAQSEEDSIIVSANRTHRTVAEMAQTTWVIEGQEIEQQVQGGKEFKDVLAQLIPGIDVSSQGRTNYGMNMRGRAIVVLIDASGSTLPAPTAASSTPSTVQHRACRSDLRGNLAVRRRQYRRTYQHRHQKRAAGSPGRS